MAEQQEFSFTYEPINKPRSARTTFDRLRAQRAKEHGMIVAAANRSNLLEFARDAMIKLALSRESREVVADDVASWLIDHGRDPSDLGNAMGSVFNTRQWEFTGAWRKSARVSNHAHQNRIWRLR